MGIKINHDGCILCVGCSSLCPVGAIEVVGTRMKVDNSKCINCGICVKGCPANVIRLDKELKKSED